MCTPKYNAQWLNQAMGLPYVEVESDNKQSYECIWIGASPREVSALVFDIRDPISEGNFKLSWVRKSANMVDQAQAHQVAVKVAKGIISRLDFFRSP